MAQQEPCCASNRSVVAAPPSRAGVLAHRWSSVDFGIVPTGLHPSISESSLVLWTVLGAVKILCNHLLVCGCILNDFFLNHIIILNTVKVS